MADERVALDFTTAIVCYTRCWPCMTGQHPGGEHPWADDDDVRHAYSIGKPESARGICGCYCTKMPPHEEEPPDLDEPPTSLDADPCPLCGEAGACDYDAEGRPLIHALNDGDDA